MGIAKKFLAFCALSLAACVGEVDSLAQDEVELGQSAEALCRGGRSIDIDPRRSLAVTDEPILAGFTFERVMTQLVKQARVPGLTPAKLFQQWWDTQNRATAENASAPHCDSEVDPVLGTTINGFPYDCREAPSEGAQATCNPFTDAACKYIPIGLFNRFDLASEDGATCGEYRIVFAKETGVVDGADRNLVIFEAALPNPQPQRGLAGCRPVVNFWAAMSEIDDMALRARFLEQFYFRGIGPIPAVVDVRHFGDNEGGYGQVRTNQFMGQTVRPRVWTLREFKLEKSCERSDGKKSCKLEFLPVTNKVNPWGGLFADNASHERAEAFQAHFASQVESLSADSLTGISMEVPDEFNSAQSHSSGSTDTNYLATFVDGGEFASMIEERLDDANSALEPVDIVARAQTQTCAGCHQLSNNDALGGGLTWPSSLGFVHVSEREPETVDGVRRFRISEALTTTFLPHRKDVLESFLKNRPGHRRGFATFSH